MKAIVVRQPWATLIALGVKSIETRPGPPNGPMRPEGVRGLPGCTVERGERIAIVAGAASVGPTDVEEFYGPNWIVLFANGRWQRTGQDVPWLPLGAVVCTVTVDDAAMVDDAGLLAAASWPVISRPETDPDRWVFWGSLGRSRDITNELPLGAYQDGRWGWLLDNVQQTEPIPCKGRQGVFQLPADVAEQVAS